MNDNKLTVSADGYSMLVDVCHHTWDIIVISKMFFSFFFHQSMQNNK